MSQPNLPIFNPRDRGRLNALRNIIAAVTEELRRQAPVAQGIVDFTTNNLPYILRKYKPFPLLSVDHITPTLVSPYDFEIFDLVNNRTPNQEVFPNISDLISQLDISELSAPLKKVELIGIDESIVDTPLPQSSLTFLKSIAFRMYEQPDGTTDEAAGPLLCEMRMQLRDDESFENENKLLGYLRNNFVAYASALTALSFGRKPFVVLHGPLVRTIGGFSDITFDYKATSELFNINLDKAGEFEVPTGKSTEAFIGDKSTQFNLPSTSEEVIDGDKNLFKFNEFCIKQCGRKCASGKVFSNPKAIPPDVSKVTPSMIKNRDYPGYCLYFWGLRSLFDLARITESNVTSVVERISAATEMSRSVFPSLLTIPSAKTDIENSSLKPALRAINVKFPSELFSRRQLYSQARKTLEAFRLSDSNIFTYMLLEGQYTAPVQIYRYQPGRVFTELFGDTSLGTKDVFEPILKTLFPMEATLSHPGYRVLMSYVRTTPLREPIRVEYFDLPHLKPASKAIGPIYLMSLPYQEYGLPIILYYADKLAHTPTKLVRTIVEREYLELILENRFSDPVPIMSILGKLSRDYFQREGLK